MVPFLGFAVQQPLRVSAAGVTIDLGHQQFQATTVDVAIGAGPPRRLSEPVLPASVASTLEQSDRLVYGQDQLLHPVKPGLVVVIGGGATAAWNVEYARKEDSLVLWVGTDPFRRNSNRKPDVRECLGRVDRHIRRGNGRGDAAWKRLREKICGFHDAMLPRNRRIFADQGVVWVEGIVKSVRIDSDGKPVVDLDGLRGARQSASVACDQVVVAIGSDPSAIGGPVYLAQALPELTWVEHDGVRASVYDRIDSKGRIVAIATPQIGGRQQVRFLGSAMVQVAENHRSFGKASTAGNTLRKALESQSEFAPQHSYGVPGSIFQCGASIPLANGRAIMPELSPERAAFIESSFQRGSSGRSAV